MSYHETLIAEINAKLDELAARAEPWRAQWIAQAICGAHADGLGNGDSADFWRYGGYETTREAVRKCISKRTDPEAAPDAPQFSLPGFDRTHLQAYYLVRREGEDVGIHVVDLSDEEIDAKEAMLRAGARTLIAHAKELSRFKAWRRAQKPAAA